MNQISIRLLIGLLCMVLIFSDALADTGVTKKVQRAPDFSLVALDGKPLRLSDYSGKVVLLDFWATWCVPCQTEVPRFIAFQKHYAQHGFQVIGISFDDSPVPVRSFYKKFKMNYPVALGSPDVAKAYGGVLGLPVTFLIDRDGTIVKQYDGKVDLDAMESEITLLLHAVHKAAASNSEK